MILQIKKRNANAVFFCKFLFLKLLFLVLLNFMKTHGAYTTNIG